VPTVYPITLYAPESQASYPHMAKRDLALWERFLRLRGAEYLAFSYDVALGGVILDTPGESTASLRGWQYSTALKIDAVGWQANQAWIIEVRPEATVSAFGSAVVYTMVARREKLSELPLIPCVVCEAIQPDVMWACAETGVQIIKI
jgi:hypothetical protein